MPIQKIRYNLNSGDFTVLGSVSAQGESRKYLLLFASGDNGWTTLTREARLKYPDYDTIIHVVWDTQYFSIGWPFPTLPLYERVHSTVSGLAIKYKNKATEAE